MTTVGKVLVFVIFAFTVACMGLALAVFNAQHGWPTKHNELVGRLTATEGQLQQARSNLTTAQAELTRAKEDVTNLNTSLTNEKAALQDLQADLAKREADAVARVKEAQEAAKQAVTDVEQLEAQIRELRTQWLASITERDAAIAERTKAQDVLVVTQAQLTAADGRNKELLTREGQLKNLISQYGIDPNQTVDLPALPSVEGVVRSLSTRNGLVEISIGSDDGLVPGHRLEVYRVVNGQPELSKYLGRVEIREVDPDRAVARIIAPAQGKIMKGDHVTSRLQ